MNKLHAVLMAIPQNTCVNSPECVAQQRLFAYLALRRSAALSDAPLDGYQKNEEEVPQPNGGFHWSVSHKRRWGAAVVSPAPVGIDVECVVDRREEFFSEVGKDREWDLLGGRGRDQLFELWTAKEAVLKANGLGIGHLQECMAIQRVTGGLVLEFADKAWSVAHYKLEDHVAAIASPKESPATEWYVIETL